MTIRQIQRQQVRFHLRAVEAKIPIQFVGVLERGSAPHVRGDDAWDFLAERKDGLSLIGLTGAEMELSVRLGCPVGIVLRSELHGDDSKRVLATLQPL